MLVLEWSCWSSSNLLLMMLIAASIGTEVNSADTSYEVMVSSAWSLTCLICSMKSHVFDVMGGTAHQRFQNQNNKAITSALISALTSWLHSLNNKA